MKPFLIFATLLALALTGACGKKTATTQDQEKEAIRAALNRHLEARGGLDLAAMDINVQDVTFQGTTAEAKVQFRAKKGDAVMDTIYQFERPAGQGAGWVVKGSRPVGGMQHPAIGEGQPMPGAGGQAPSQGGVMGLPGPPGISSSPQGGALPPGHPPITPENQQQPESEKKKDSAKKAPTGR